MDLSFIIEWLLGIAAAANIVLGVSSYRKAPFSLINRLFLCLAVNNGIWALCVMAVVKNNDYDSLLFWIRISHVIAAFIPFFINVVINAFHDEKNYPWVKVLPLLFFSLALAAASFTPAIVEGVALPLENKELIYGPFFPLYALYFGAAMIYIIYSLFRQLRSSRGLVRYQIRFFIGGIFASFFLGAISNLFFPMLGIRALDLRPIGPVFTLIMVASISYAIVKFRLMDIRLAVRKVVSYVLALALLAGAIIGVFAVMEINYSFYLEANFLSFTLILVILAALLFHPLKEGIQSIVDRYLFREAYDYYNTLIDANKAMVSILNRDKLLHFLVDTIVNKIYIEKAVIYLKEVDGSFSIAAESNLGPFVADNKQERLQSDSMLLEHMEKKAEVMLLSDFKYITDSDGREMLAGEMKKLGAEAAIPILIEGRLEAILFLGIKISGEPYSREDVRLLSALALQVAVALKNAQLYNEILGIKQYLENILENMGNGLIAVDAQGRITTFNSATEKFTGISSGEVMGKKVEDVLSPALAYNILQTLKNGQSRSEIEVELSLGAFSSFLCCNTARVDALENGEQGAIMVLSDITRIKELEREKSQNERLASLGKMAAGIAHEVKNPLVSIKTFAELLPEKYDDQEFRHNFSKIVSEEIARINKLIMELLNFSRNNRPAYEEVDIRELIDEVMMLLSPQINTQGIELKQHCHQNIPAVKADRDQLKQALLNICLNAVQAMPDGGELGIEVLALKGSHDTHDTRGAHGTYDMTHDTHGRGMPSLQVAGQVTALSANPSFDRVKIIIKDTGTGIDPVERDRIFDPFFTTKVDGIGIGLSISHRIITDHGGNVQFSSSSNGTIFEIYLPGASSLRTVSHR